MKPCWSCGTTTPECLPECECAKCIDPEDYARWRRDEPEEYQDWLVSQQDDGNDW